jgi:hypothetical protein
MADATYTFAAHPETLPISIGYLSLCSARTLYILEDANPAMFMVRGHLTTPR